MVDRASDTVATTPLVIGVVFMPQSSHVIVPALLLQESSLFPAAGPVVTVADEKSTVEYPSVHSTDAAGSPPAFVKLRLRATAEPGKPEPEDKPSVTPWAEQRTQAAKPIIDRRPTCDAMRIKYGVKSGSGMMRKRSRLGCTPLIGADIVWPLYSKGPTSNRQSSKQQVRNRLMREMTQAAHALDA